MNDATFAGLPIFPVEASTQAVRTDAVFFLEFGISLVILGVVAFLVIGFSIRYRRGSKARRGPLPSLIRSEIEIGWTLGTIFLALFLFWWASATYFSALATPPKAIEIHVLAKQWMWKVEHPDGAREINALHVPVNEPVRLIMTSQDVIHSFFVPAFRMKKDVLPGRATETWFQATRTGTYHLECAEYCGTDHSRMTGSIIVMSPDDYARWQTAQPQADNLAAAGGTLFDMLGCASCHETDGKRAPVLYGLYGRRVKLSTDEIIVADSAYIRDSILQPRKDLVAGYPPIMPSFKGAVSDADLARLVAYIRSLKNSQGYKP